MSTRSKTSLAARQRASRDRWLNPSPAPIRWPQSVRREARVQRRLPEAIEHARGLYASGEPRMVAILRTARQFKVGQRRIEAAL
jgi:hypothetical protein